MKRTILSLGFVAALISIASVASASTTTPLVSHEQFTVGKGDIETQLSITPIIFAGDASEKIFNISFGANYFVTNILAPGAEFAFSHSGGANGGSFVPNLKAYFPGLKRVLPYAQVGLGYAPIGGADLFDLRIGPGIDFMLANNVAIGFQFKYDLGLGNGTVHEIQFPVNFAIYFKL